MIKTTTPNDVILNIYNEANEKIRQDFTVCCLLDDDLAEERDEMSDIKISLEELSFQPRQKSIDAILMYSASFMSKY